MTTLHTDTPIAVADRSELAALFVRWLETHQVPDGLFADDVFCDLSLPHWRLQARGVEGAVALREGGHPCVGTVPRHRVDPTATGFVIEIEERWHDGGQDWYCRELMRCDVRDGRVSELSVYCTGDWDEARVAEHAASVDLIRP